MKRFNNLYENIYKTENIKACYYEVMRNTKNKRQVYKLQNNAKNVIRTIYEELKNERYVVKWFVKKTSIDFMYSD